MVEQETTGTDRMFSSLLLSSAFRFSLLAIPLLWSSLSAAKEQVGISSVEPPTGSYFCFGQNLKNSLTVNFEYTGVKVDSLYVKLITIDWDTSTRITVWNEALHNISIQGQQTWGGPSSDFVIERPPLVSSLSLDFVVGGIFQVGGPFELHTASYNLHKCETGNLLVTITPSEAVGVGAQWQVDGGAWQDSDVTVADLLVGTHSVSFKELAGWNKPPDQQVSIRYNQVTQSSGTYVRQTGTVLVAVTPSTAADVGAQWKVDGGTWHASGVALAGLSVGPHSISFSDISGWDTPPDQQVSIRYNEVTQASGVYVLQTGSLLVTLAPLEASNAGAQWQVDSGVWQNSGTTVTGLSVGPHTVSFKDVIGWNRPSDLQVSISNNQVTQTSGVYTPPAGSLTVTVIPSEAVGAQWQVDGGVWQNSGATVAGLSVGAHLVSFKDVNGWNKPTDQQFNISNNQVTSASGTYVRQTGGLLVEITPSEATGAGAQWQVDGGAWQNGGNTVTGLSVGFHTVSFKAISGWIKPTDQQASIVYSQTTQVSGVYVRQTGSLLVTMMPSEAAGAQWQVDGGTWQNSGATITGLSVGSHTVSFTGISGWIKPTDQQASIVYSQTTQVSGVYVRQTGSLLVTVTPSEAAGAGARWQVDGGAWQNSGATVAGLSVGAHTVSFKEISGWNKPTDKQVDISYNQTAQVSGVYLRQTGSLLVTVTPSEAMGAGAQWQVDGGAWQNSGATVMDLSVGTHTVSFKEASGWNKPSSQQVSILYNQVTQASGNYTPPAGSLTVTVTPSEAMGAGAQWQVDGGAWQNSGATVMGLSVGTHTASFRNISGWNKPSDQQVSISNNQVTQASGVYVRQTGNLLVTITPSEVAGADAQWQLDGGTWQDSDVTVTELPVGLHELSFKNISGWNKPSDQQVSISYNQVTQASGVYVRQTGSLLVTITPSEATSTDAQWQVDGGTWQDSGVTVTELPVGSHAVSFKNISGWNKPSDQQVSIIYNQVTRASGGYLRQTGAVLVTIFPSEAASAGAQWQVDGGNWQNSGVTVEDIRVGSHAVSFKSIDGWNRPSDQQVSVTNDHVAEVSGLYTPSAGTNSVGTVMPVTGGALNGTAIDGSHREITVEAGTAITGSVVVQTNNLMPATSVATLGGTVDWGDRTTQPWVANGRIGTGSQTYRVNVNKMASNTSGDYYIIIAFAGEKEISQVMSCTNWSAFSDGHPVWNDGNDVGFDWAATEYNSAETNGAVPYSRLGSSGQYSKAWLPATAITVHVTPAINSGCPACNKSEQTFDGVKARLGDLFLMGLSFSVLLFVSHMKR